MQIARRQVSLRSRPHTGLTTLEWLLIVAAVAGLAALAVVLVQNVVDETAEEISGSNARITAAQVAAKAITDSSDSDDDRAAACRRLGITYSDAFADAPKRAALWSDPDTTGKGGNCFIISKIAKDALEKASQNSAVNSLPTCKSNINMSFNPNRDLTTAELGGRTIAYDRDASPKCHLT